MDRLFRQSAARMSREQIEWRIVRGNLKPEEELSIQALCEQLEVSRTPVREALRELLAKGLVEQRINGRFYVAAVSQTDIENVYAVRAALEQLALAQAIERATDNQLLELKTLSETMVALQDLTVVPDLGRDFHGTVMRLSQNTVANSMMGFLQARIDQYRYLSTTSMDRSQAAVKEHVALANAVVDRDIVRARTLLEQHINSSRLSALKSLELYSLSNDDGQRTPL